MGQIIKNNASVKSIATASGVSAATVSRVLNADPAVKESTRILVQKNIKKAGYSLNRVAQRLRTKKKTGRLIGLLIPDIQNPFYVDVIRGIEEIAYANGSAMVIGNFSQDEDKERVYIDILRAESVDGFIVAPAHGRDHYIEELAMEGYPLVCIDRGLTNLNVDVVTVDNQEGAYKATEHLIKLGHRKIAHIHGDKSIPTTNERILGYKLALQSYDIPVNDKWIVGMSSDFESGKFYTRKLMTMQDTPTAIFTGNNLLTLGLLDISYQMKIEIPKMLALVGFDDMYWATSLNPPLTAIRQSGTAIGRRAVEMLYRQIENPEREPSRVILKTELMVRKSCGS
ncbi:MAG: LacI family DNA-binding transcriptional regulator [Ginsengibacter sp.]